MDSSTDRDRAAFIVRKARGFGFGAAAAQQCWKPPASAPKTSTYILFSTMTPDHFFPGSGSLLAAKLGCPTIPAPDLRTQCAASLRGFQIADALLRAGGRPAASWSSARKLTRGLMPWRDWDILEGTTERRPSAED